MWIDSTIADSCTLVTDGSHFSPKSVLNGKFMVSVKDFSQFGFDFSNCRMISDEDYVSLKKSGCVPEEDDILVGKDGARYFEDIIIYKQPERPALLSSIAIIRSEKSKLLPRYLYYMMTEPSFKKNVRDNYGSGSAIPRIILKDFKRMPLRYPPLPTQQKIAKILSSLDDKIELNNRMNANLEAQAQAVFKSWFVDFEPFGGVMPDGWTCTLIGDLCDTISKTHRKEQETLIFLNTGDITNGQFNHAIYSSVAGMPGQAKKSIQEGDILYSEIRPINRHYAFVNFPADDYVVSTKLMVLRANGICPRRLYQFLTSPETIQELQMEAESRSGTFPQIRFENIANLEILIASQEVEAQYSEVLNSIYNTIDLNNLENQKLVQLRDTLLPRLMSGELDVDGVEV